MLAMITSWEVYECPKHGEWRRGNVHDQRGVSDRAQSCPWAVYDGWREQIGPFCGEPSPWRRNEPVAGKILAIEKPIFYWPDGELKA